jgi:hypothetical protein
MRDFRDAKAMARTLRQALAAKGVTVSNSESLELIAKALGAKDWNTLAAMIQAAEPSDPPVSPATPPSAPASAPPQSQRFSPELEASLHRAVALAAERKHQYTTLEHLLAALTQDADAVAVMRGCQVDPAVLNQTLLDYIDEELGSLVGADAPVPTAGFHRVIQRMVIHNQSSGGGQMTGSNVLIAIFAERESHAAAFLGQQGMTRFDAVNFHAHGVVKGGGKAA